MKLRIILKKFFPPARFLVWFGLSCLALFCHFEEVEREYREPSADQLWSQATGQPPSPSGAPVTGLITLEAPENTH